MSNGNKILKSKLMIAPSYMIIFNFSIPFSIGLGDVTPSRSLLKMKGDLVQNGYDKCDEYIKQLEDGSLTSTAGRSEEETLEDLILR